MRSTFCLLLSLTVLRETAMAASTLAQASEPQRTEAKERFDRGLRLLEKTKDPTGALAEFKRAYELAPAPRTLFMIGIVYGVMNRPVEALTTLDEVLRNPGTLTADQLAVARKRRDEQMRRVGKVELVGAPPDTTIATGTDSGLKVTRDRFVWVAPGSSTLLITAPGQPSVTKAVTIAAGETIAVPFDVPSGPPPLIAVPPPPPSPAAAAPVPAPPAPAPAPAAAPPPPPAPPSSPTPSPTPEVPVGAAGEVSSGRTARLVGLSVAGAGVAVGALGFILRGIGSSKLEAIERDAAANKPYNDDNGSWQTFDRTGVGLMLAGGAAVTTGAVLYFLNRNPEKATTVSILLTPSGSGLLQIGGRY